MHNQADLDLLIVRDGVRLGYDVKYTDRPATTRSQHLALEHLGLDHITLVNPGDANYPLTDRIRVEGLSTAIARLTLRQRATLGLPRSTPDHVPT